MVFYRKTENPSLAFSKTEFTFSKFLELDQTYKKGILLLFLLKNRFSWASQHHCPGTRMHMSLSVKAARHVVGRGGQLIMSRLHGSLLPSLRRASATSLLKTDRFWVNLRKKEERLGAVGRPRWCEQGG